MTLVAAGDLLAINPQSDDHPAAPPTRPVQDPAVTERLRRFREQSAESENQRARPMPTLRASHLYNSPSGPVEVVVRGGPENTASLLLLDAAGEVMGVARNPAGRVDILSALPGVSTLDRAAWIQLVVDEKPVGAPLVVQPLREPPPVRTMRALRPDSTVEYTKIIGWGDQPLDPEDPSIKTELAKWIAGDPPVNSGFKIYTEMDALIRTDHGEIRIAFAPDEAPATVWNFRTLVRDGFYDDGGFHRVVPVDRQGRPFVIQGGDPTLSGNGGPGFALPLEPSRLPHDYGVISMARADDPHSAGSQFFIALGREGCARLDGQYCAFGYAVGGNRTIDSIASTPIADIADGRPTAIPRIISVRLVDSQPRMPGIDRRNDRVKQSAQPGTSTGETR